MAQRVLQDWAFKARDGSIQEAKKLGYLARSALKLKEIQDKHRVIGRGATVLDLGCSPGAWMQVACQALGPTGGSILGVDLQAVDLPIRHTDSRVRALQADARGLSASALLSAHPRGFHCVLSDMAPSTAGAGGLDALRSLALAGRAVDIAIGEERDGDDDGAAAQSSSPRDAPADAAGCSAAGAPGTSGQHLPCADGAVDPERAGVLRRHGSLVVKLLEGEGNGRRELEGRCKCAFERVHWVRPRATRPESKEVFLVALGRRTGAVGMLLPAAATRAAGAAAAVGGTGMSAAAAAAAAAAGRASGGGDSGGPRR